MNIAMLELTIFILLVPGVVFAVGVSIREWMNALVGAGFGFLASIGILVFMCGIASVIMTPVGIVWGVVHRPWRSPTAHWLWVFLSVGSAIGVLLVIGRYAVL